MDSLFVRLSSWVDSVCYQRINGEKEMKGGMRRMTPWRTEDGNRLI
jgi:hypothetical protein